MDMPWMMIGDPVMSDLRRGRKDWLEHIEMEAAIRQGIAEGLTDGKVATRAGCSEQTVYRYRRAHKIPPELHHVT